MGILSTSSAMVCGVRTRVGNACLARTRSRSTLFSARWAHCRNKRENLNIERHSRLMAQNAKREKTGEYHSFDMTMVEGLKELISRVESGKLAKPEDPWS